MRNDDLRGAYAECEQLASEHYENFPVASRLVPRAMRRHVAAVYAFARMADDFADEGSRSVEERLKLLDDWQNRLHACVRTSAGRASDGESGDDRIFLALGATIRACNLPVSLFDDLLSAFRQDITVHRYDTWDAVLDYCRRSANPVGRIVLRIAGYDDPRLDRSADALCTALQLTNFWQDLGRDWSAGRLYVPMDEVRTAAADTRDLDRRRMTSAWVCVLRRVAGRTHDAFMQGRQVCDGVSGRLRYELRLTWLGGTHILERLDRLDYDVFTSRPALSMSDAPSLLWRAVFWRDAGRRAARLKP